MTLYILFFLVFVTIAGSWGWGMRGTIIGGEKGAMLPGALIGLFVALYSGSAFFESNPFLLAGIGALSMYCGGNMTYADTFCYTEKSNDCYNMKKGMAALFIKGAVWFGLFSGYLSMYISVLSGSIKLFEMIMFTVFFPVSATLFYLIFNKPFDPMNNKFPKFYFSLTRKETWGGLLGLLLELIVFSACIKDYSVLAMTAGGILFGGFGWMFAQFLQVSVHNPDKKGRSLFKKSYKKGYIDPWKIMETVLGAIGGLGTAVTFLISKPLFAEKFMKLDTEGPSLMLGKPTSGILVGVYALVLIADSAQYFTKSKKYKKLCGKWEFAVYSSVPMILAFFGCTETILIASFVTLLLVLCQEFIEKCFGNGSDGAVYKLLILAPVFILMLIQIYTGKPFNVAITMVLYTIIYEGAFFIFRLLDPNMWGKSGKTVHGYFIICCILLMIFAAVY